MPLLQFLERGAMKVGIGYVIITLMYRLQSLSEVRALSVQRPVPHISQTYFYLSYSDIRDLMIKEKIWIETLGCFRLFEACADEQ